jgi:hypothetical protein
MKITALSLAFLLSASSFPLHAQVVASPPGTPSAPVKPEPSCPCDHGNFKPLNDKARAVAEYWTARRNYNVAGTIGATAALFALLARDGGLLNEAQNSLAKAGRELDAARAKALSLDGIKVTDGDDKTVEIKLKKGVDYTF